MGRGPEAMGEMAPEGEALVELASFTRQVARQAGALAMVHFHRPHQVRYKGEDRRNPVTEADEALEEYLVGAIQERYPHHAILAEESPERASPASPFLWVMDPLDGTTNFVHSMPLFAVSIALLYRGRPVTAAIYLPYPGREEGSLFHASAGGGAFQDEELISVAPEPQPGAGRLALLPGRYSRFLSFKGAMTVNHGEVRALGSICYEAALVARGVAQYGLFTGPRLWDVAAATLLVQEAGGLVLVGQGLRRWEPFEAFPPYPYQGEGGKLEELRRWSRPMVMGNAAVVSFVAARLRRRWPAVGGALRRWVRRRRAQPPRGEPRRGGQGA